MVTALVLLFTEVENAEFFVATDGVSELVSERAPSKLETVRIVDGMPGVLLMLGDGERPDAASPGCSLFLVGGVLVCGEVTVGVMAWRWTCPWVLEGFGVWGPGCSGGFVGGRDLVFSVEAQRSGMSASCSMLGSNKRKAAQVAGKRGVHFDQVTVSGKDGQ